jgi:PAS domain S-box-containing protein
MGRVLVVEDNRDHQDAIAEVIRRFGHAVDVADDGRAGLAAVAEHRPDLIVADVDMPYLNGLQLCRMLHAVPEFAGIPVVLVTAYLPPSDPQLSTAGAAAVIGKPFSIRELADVVLAYLPDGDGAARPAGSDQPVPREDAPAADPAPFTDALLHSLDVGVAACDTAGRLVVFNQALRSFFGAESLGVPLAQWPKHFALRHHDGAAVSGDELPLIRALSGEHVRHAALMADDHNGRPHWFHVNARPVRNEAGVMLGAVSAVHDVTAEYLSRQYERCKTEVLEALAASPDTATAGAQTVRAIGLVLGWPYVRLWLIDEVADRLRPAATYTAAGEQPLPVPASFARGHGLAGQSWEQQELVWVPDIAAAGSPVLPEVAESTAYRAAGAVPVRSGDRVTGVLTFFSDFRQEPDPALAVLLTGLAGNIGAYLERHRAQELSTHLAAATDEYIALVGHELRTPLTSIATYTELIAASEDSTPVGDIRSLLEVVERNNVRLLGLVDQLLDLAALETGHVTLAVAEVDLVAVVKAAVEDHVAAARDHGITFDVRAPEGLTVPGDSRRLRQAVAGLVQNAIKFSPPDTGVGIRVYADGETAVLTVTDAGAGVAAEEQPYVFRRLYRARNARHTGIPGAGLGLSLSRAVVERHHGAITLASRPGGGTTVTVRLPRRGQR